MPMPTGEMLAALPDFVRNDVLCQAVDDARMTGIIGGPVRREVRPDGSGDLAACHIVSPGNDIEITTTTSGTSSSDAAEVLVHGKRARLEHLGDRTEVSVPVLPGSESAQNYPYGVRPILSIKQRPGADDKVTAVATAVLEAATKPGPSIPKDDETRIPPRRADPTPGFGVIGSAWPQITWQLCTILADEAHLDLQAAEAKFDGECSIESGNVRTYARSSEVTSRDDTAHFTETISGRPASRDAGGITVKLTDEPAPTANFAATGPFPPGFDYKAFTERVVAKLVGKG
ncbi:hypothetical protein [Amycolatopsis sp. CA-230715]|uniref:hypothetical protein n=1 Tax=Amycolatopsis sp. CA-230715 TaxID=2745196 RepID=UPI001C0214CC|nr:hypothetical protein [Amycolatopsis sp. CA-230715]